MKQISLTEAFRFLKNCRTVVVDQYYLVYPSLEDLNGDPDNQFLYLSWVDDDARSYAIVVAEGQNQSVTIHGTVMTLTDMEGDRFTITLLTEMELESDNKTGDNPQK